MATITPVNSFTMPTPTTTVQKDTKNKTQLGTHHILLPQGLLLLTGGGYSAKTYFDNRGKAIVYQDMLKVFAEGSAEHNGIKDCLKLAQTNMKDAKRGGITLATTIALATTWMLISHSYLESKYNKNITPKEEKTVTLPNEPKLVVNA